MSKTVKRLYHRALATMFGSVERSERGYVTKWRGEQRECELCETEKLCSKRCNLLTCRECQTEFLPRASLL